VACAPVQLSLLVVNPANFIGEADEIAVSSSTKQTVCGQSVTISAGVAAGGSPVVDGTTVLFNAGFAGGVFQTTTTSGQTSTSFVIPVGFMGKLVVGVSAGSAAAQVEIDVVCFSAGPPAQVSISVTPDSITCANTATVLAKVTDQFAHAVTDGTAVTFSTTVGSIVPSAPTSGGLAQSVLTSSPGRPGIATIAVRAGSAAGQVTLAINCATPTATAPAASPTTTLSDAVATAIAATVVPPTFAPIATVAPAATSVPAASGGAVVISPPNTGDGGLVP